MQKVIKLYESPEHLQGEPLIMTTEEDFINDRCQIITGTEERIPATGLKIQPENYLEAN